MSISTSSAGQAATLDFGIVNPEFSHFLLSRVNLLLLNLLPALSGSAPRRWLCSCPAGTLAAGTRDGPFRLAQAALLGRDTS